MRYQKTYIALNLRLPKESYTDSLEKLARLMDFCNELDWKFRVIVFFKKGEKKDA